MAQANEAANLVKEVVPVELRQHRRAMLLEEFQYDFCVATGAKWTAAQIPFRQLRGIVDLTIECDDRFPTGGDHRLIGARIEVADGQPAKSQPGVTNVISVESGGVGASVGQ